MSLMSPVFVDKRASSLLILHVSPSFMKGNGVDPKCHGARLPYDFYCTGTRFDLVVWQLGSLNVNSGVLISMAVNDLNYRFRYHSRSPTRSYN